MATMNDKLSVFESFAGYGSQSMALRRLNIPFEVVGISEIDKYAIRAYMAIHGETTNYGDICKIDWSNVPDFDLFTYSFPCTDISSAGQQKGLSKGSGTRSGLLWECERAIEIKRPKYLLMENVKALTQKKFIKEFREWQTVLNSLGYTNFSQVLNAKDFGVPQNRERVFMVSMLGDSWFNFPQPIKLERCLHSILEDNVNERYYLSQKLVDGFLEHRAKSEEKGRGFKFAPRDLSKPAVCISTQAGARQTDNFIDMRQMASYIGVSVHPFSKKREFSGVSPDVSPCLLATDYKCPKVVWLRNEPKILGYTRDGKGNVQNYHEKDIANTIHTSTGGGGNTDQFIIQRSRGFNHGGTFNIAPTITSNAWSENNFLCERSYIRKLTPRECFRLMDVSEDDIDKIQRVGISNAQQYKMAGNSIVVAVLEEIFKQLFLATKQTTLFG